MKPKIGLALGGGGARGLCHIGVLEVLEKHGLIPDIITGTSMGALVGGVYSFGLDLDKIKEAMEKYARFIKMLDPSLNFRGLLSGRRPMKRMIELVGEGLVEECKIPFGCTSVDLLSGKMHNFTKGRLSTSIRASISIPGIFTPVDYEGMQLVDGGVLSRVPINLAREMGADIVIGVDALGVPVPQRKPYRRIDRIIERSYKIIDMQSSKEELSRADLLVMPHLAGSSILAFKKAEHNIEQGKLATVFKLGDIKRLFNSDIKISQSEKVENISKLE